MPLLYTQTDFTFMEASMLTKVCLLTSIASIFQRQPLITDGSNSTIHARDKS